MIENKRFGQSIYVQPTEAGTYSPDKGWKQANSKTQDYTINGINYHLVEKKDRNISLFSLSRIAGIAFGLLCTVVTLGGALFSKTVRQLFSGRQVVKILEANILDKKIKKTSSETLVDDESKEEVKIEKKPETKIEVKEEANVREKNIFTKKYIAKHVGGEEKYANLPIYDLSEYKKQWGNGGYPNNLVPSDFNSPISRGINGFSDYEYLIVKYNQVAELNLGCPGIGVHLFFGKDDSTGTMRYQFDGVHSRNQKTASLDYIFWCHPDLKNNLSGDNLSKLLTEGKLVDNQGNTIIELSH